MALTKTELSQRVAEEAGLNRAQASRAIDALLNSITQSLASGEEVRLTGFGTFRVAETKARTGHNPQTKETIEIAAGKRAAFKPGEALKSAVKGK